MPQPDVLPPDWTWVERPESPPMQGKLVTGVLYGEAISQSVDVTARHTEGRRELQKGIDCTMNAKTKLEEGKREKKNVGCDRGVVVGMVPGMPTLRMPRLKIRRKVVPDCLYGCTSGSWFRSFARVLSQCTSCCIVVQGVVALSKTPRSMYIATLLLTRPAALLDEPYATTGVTGAVRLDHGGQS